MLEFLGKLFGSKSDRDIKLIQPIVEQIKTEYDKLGSLSHDELRSKTIAFKEHIRTTLAGIDQQITDLKAKGEDPELAMDAKTELYD